MLSLDEATLNGVLSTHQEELTLLEDELQFLNGGGILGSIFPRNSPQSPSMKRLKLKARKISWDMPEYGDIWYGLKYYYRLVINLQEINMAISKRIELLWQKQNLYERCLDTILTEVKQLRQFRFVEWVTGLPPDLQDHVTQLPFLHSMMLQFPSFYLDLENMPKLPPTLGKFTVMLSIAEDVRNTNTLQCIPPMGVRSGFHDDSTNAAPVITIDDVSWLEVVIVVSTRILCAPH
jgi:hypothetical protein